MLPDILNHNNEAIKKEFDNIYDTSLDRLNKSVYAPMGSVKAHFGEFVNLSAEYITLKNVDSLKYSIKQAVVDIVSDEIDEHNTLRGRFVDSGNERAYHGTAICHDASAVAYDTVSNVYQQVESVKSDITDVSAKASRYDTSISDLGNKVNVMNSSIAELKTSLNNVSTRVAANTTTIGRHST